MNIFKWFSRPKPAPVAEPALKEPGMKISPMALAHAAHRPLAATPGDFRRPKLIDGVVPPESKDAVLAMDRALAPVYAYVNPAWAGMGFIGYPYLAELSQRPEYRKMSDVIAKEMTRKWIKLETTGDDDKADKIKALEKSMRRYGLRRKFREAALQDGLFGRSQIYIDVKTPSGQPAKAVPDELKTPLVRASAKIRPGSLVGFKVIEPVWTTPFLYSSDDPTRPDFYKPTSWFVLGKEYHASRLLNFVSREVPDILKPSYNFGGLSMTQLAIPYVDNWLRTRQSVADLINGFSVGVLKTNMASLLSGDPGDSVFTRIDLFNKTRSNRGAWAIDKDTEEFSFENVPLAGLDKLQAQSQEQMSAVSSIPLVKLLGITPSGLNATSDGEIRVFYDEILAMQEALFRDNLQACLEVIQLSEFGEIDPEITFSFVPLWQPTDLEKAQVRKSDADTDAVLIGSGVISPDDARNRLVADPENGYHSLEVDPESDEDFEDDEDDFPDDDPDDDGGKPPAQDSEFEENKHPRAPDGKFGSGSGGGGTVSLTGDELGDATSGKELRQKAMAYAERFIGKQFTNASTGNAIQVTKTGVKHTIAGSGPDLIRTVPAIPDLIQSATLVESEEDKSGDRNVKSVETYAASIELGGKKREVVMTVKEYIDGRRYYDHGFMKTE